MNPSIQEKREEKRKDTRFTCACKARLAVFGRSVFYPSKIVDFSDAGMRLKTSFPARVGATLLVQVIGPDEDDRSEAEFGCPLNRTIGIGQVRWCEPPMEASARGYTLGLDIQAV